jgi:hypothetical protein
MIAADTIGAGSSTRARQVIRIQDNLKDQCHQAVWCDREEPANDGEHEILQTSTNDRRWPFNVVLSIIPGAATALFALALVRVVNAPKKGSAWQ